MPEAPTVLVSGASSGIGRACALRLAEGGWRVLAGVRRAEDGLRLRALAAGIEPLQLDVTDAAQVEAAAETVARRAGRTGLSGLVNNAGIAVGGPLEHLPLEHFRRSLEVNVTGALALSQACLPELRRARGRIVNISSISGRMALPFVGAYAASKHALEALSDSLRVELAPWGVAVVLIEPGNVQTPIWDKSLRAARELRAGLPAEAERDYGPVLDGLEAEVGRRRSLTAEQVAEQVLRALSQPRPRARYPMGLEVRLADWVDRLPPSWRDGLIRAALARRRARAQGGRAERR